ncbi:MAG: xanthine dehydrogenase family protein molybdopterin-binding subunit [Pseudomonadales bacterium]|jgi:CO/xanthine dehydrogenase Mo-binding subunit|nr:xanthine dehydrogenase family protein molybdopterin-binding subunit [Pseudomonadales bacterium]
MAEARDFRYVGTRPIRPDGVDKVTGRANYGADFAMPGMLYGAVVRSPHAHALIRGIDVSRALALDGVKAVVTGGDFPSVAHGDIEGGEGGGDYADMAANVMARAKALYHGHAVAAVCATSQRIANEAARLVEVDYEVLTPVLDLDAAMADDAPLLDEQLFTEGLPEKPSRASNVAAVMELAGGDLDAGFAEADVVVERTYHTPTVHQGYIEPHACVARWGQDDQSVIWCSSQGAFDIRSMSAKVLGVSVGSLKVIPAEIGGGFGGKTTIYLEPVAVLLSKKAGRPVKRTMTREEVFRASGPASACKAKVRIGAKRDGTLTAMYAWLGYEAGAYKGSPMGPGVMCAFAPYKCPNFRIEGYDVLVNKPKVAAYRAPGAPQSNFAVESALDEIAREIGMDPIDLRLANAVSEGDQATYGPKFRAIGLIECLQAAKAHPNYAKPVAAGEGRGVAVGFWFNAGMQSSAEVHVNEDGTVTVIEGNPDIGGSRASMALMAAEELGVPYEQVRVVVADTETAGFTNVTGGSRVTFATGMAVIEAARDIVGQLKARAAALWSLDAEMVDYVDGRVVPKPGVNTDAKPLSLADMAAMTAKTGGPLLGRASLNARGAGPGFSVNICDAAVDRETGKVDVTAFTAIQDAGKAIHPAYVEGQLQGGAVQGIGWALNEEYVYDERGVMQNAGFLDYRIPVASDLPMIDTQIIEVPNPGHPYGVRGVGETPIVAPLAAVANAVARATGVRMTHLPLAPHKVLANLDAGGDAILGG